MKIQQPATLDTQHTTSQMPITIITNKVFIVKNTIPVRFFKYIYIT